MCALNGNIAKRNEGRRLGKLRTGQVGISGTDYIPPIPDYQKASEELSAILKSDASDTERALDLFAWGARSQLFWDGNKRTSLTLANKLMLMTGRGMITITDKHMEEFNVCLLNYLQFRRRATAERVPVDEFDTGNHILTQKSEPSKKAPEGAFFPSDRFHL